LVTFAGLLDLTGLEFSLATQIRAPRKISTVIAGKTNRAKFLRHSRLLATVICGSRNSHALHR
jgi:hypothetical protein